MRISHVSRVVIAILVVCLVGLLVIVAPRFRASASSVHSGITSRAAHPGISTNCPAPGTANAAVMPPIKLGTHPNIVYIVNENDAQGHPTAGTLKRYDIVTGSKVEVVKLASVNISGAQVSADGQWLLFVTTGSGQNKLQLVRMDGQFLQTLYCGAAEEVQWSTDQRLMLFSDGVNVDLLNVTNGALQVEATPGGATVFLHIRTWLDNTRAYITSQRPDGPPETLLLLDTTKGPNQNFQNIPVVFDASLSTPFCWDFDSSFDGRSLFTSQCAVMPPPKGPGAVPCCGPSVIASRSPTGGASYSYVYVNQAQAFTAVRAINSNTLLFTVANGNGDTSQNGLWKVGTDGSSPLRLTTSGEFAQFTQFPWSNVSRDDTKYALRIVNFSSSSNTYTLEYGSLSGGSPIVFASITNTELDMVGWTTM